MAYGLKKPVTQGPIYSDDVRICIDHNMLYICILYVYVYIYMYCTWCIYIYIYIVNLPPILPALICGPCRREKHLLVLEGRLRRRYFWGWQDVGQDSPGKDANPPG